MWILFPRPLISSDYAVVAGLRLGGSQGKMPTLLLLGCLPWRHSQNLQITEKLRCYNETFRDCFLTLSQVNTFNQDWILTVVCWEFNRMYLGGKIVDSTGSFGQASQTKISRMSHVLLKKCLFLCKNSVISHESAIICLCYIFPLLKIVFFIALYYNISLIILTTLCNGWKFQL